MSGSLKAACLAMAFGLLLWGFVRVALVMLGAPIPEAHLVLIAAACGVFGALFAFPISERRGWLS